jgi:hypothetical protein
MENNMKLTKARLKQIIREELQTDSDRPSTRDIEEVATWQNMRLAKWAGMDMPGMESVTDSILRDFRGLADPETHIASSWKSLVHTTLVGNPRTSKLYWTCLRIEDFRN